MPRSKDVQKVTARIDTEDYKLLKQLAKENKEEDRKPYLHPHYWNDLLRRIVRQRCDHIRGGRDPQYYQPKRLP